MCGYTNEREEKSGIHAWRRKNQEGKRKKKMKIERRRVGTCVKEKKLREKRKKERKRKNKKLLSWAKFI